MITAQGEKAAIRYEFSPEKMTWALENKTNDRHGLLRRLRRGGAGGEERQGRVGEDARRRPARHLADPQVGERPPGTPAAPGSSSRAASRIWGPWEQKYQVWEASLAPHEKRTVTVEVGLTSKEEAEKAAADGGRQARPAVGPRPVRAAGLSGLPAQDAPARDRSRCAAGCARRSTALEYRLTGKPLEGARRTNGRPLPSAAGAQTFDATLPAPAGGWYKLEVRALKDGKEVAQAAVDHVGVGEVFVGAGQSNSTNCGQEKIQQTSGMVSSFSGTDWRLADDPQPGCPRRPARLPGGSFWPAFGDAMSEKYHVPIGVAVDRPFGHERQPMAAGRRAVPVDDGRMNAAGPRRLPGGAVAPGRIGHGHAVRRVRPQDDGADRAVAQGGGLGRAVVRGPGLLPQSQRRVVRRRRARRRRSCGIPAWRWKGRTRTRSPATTATTTAQGIHFSPKGLRGPRPHVGGQGRRLARQGIEVGRTLLVQTTASDLVPKNPSRDVLIRDEGDPPAVRRPARYVHRPLAAEEPAQHVDLLVRQRHPAQGHVFVLAGGRSRPSQGEEHERPTVGRGVREPVVELVVGDLFLLAAVRPASARSASGRCGRS